MSRSTYNHLHKYTAVNKARKSYRCTIPDCPHSISASMLLNRRAVCNVCGAELIVTAEHLRNANITCNGCGRGKFMPNLPIVQQPGYTPDKVDAASLLDKMGLKR